MSAGSCGRISRLNQASRESCMRETLQPVPAARSRRICGPATGVLAGSYVAGLSRTLSLSGTPEGRTLTMLTAIRSFFDRHIAAQADEPQATAERRVQIASAVLLVEVARS